MSNPIITGLKEAQRDNQRRINALQGDVIGRGVRTGTIAAHRFAVASTHVDTGALQASHRMEYRQGWGGIQGKVFIDPNARNPRSRALTSQYGVVEHNRGGSHAFYEIVVTRFGGQIAAQAGTEILNGLR